MSTTSKRARIYNSNLRESLLDENFVQLLKSSLTNSSNIPVELSDNFVNVIHKPYTVCIIQNFIHNISLLKSAVKELKNVEFREKSNDLYHFKQSDNVRSLTNFPFIQELYNCISDECLHWVGKIFGKPLKETVSATFSSYSYTDRLLCHDDKCGDRFVAFILYLMDEWKEEYGGSLQLFSTDCYGYPDTIVESVVPKFNTLVLFEVTHTSFHQVSEVLTKNKDRISLNGWFHLDTKRIDNSICKVLEVEKNFGNEEKFDLKNSFSSNYLKETVKEDIKALFSANSEIQLDNFLLPNVWNNIQNDLKNSQIKWLKKGPANIRNYQVAESHSLPSSLKSLKTIFESKLWFNYLKSITALDLAPSETSDLNIWEKGIMPQCTFEFQKWTHSSYSLLHDKDSEFHKEGLDISLRIPYEILSENGVCNESSDIPESGHIIYIDADSKDEECLLHIGYKMNSLALIFRDSKTLRFTKYLDSEAKPFYQVFCTYQQWQPPSDQPGLKHCLDESSSDESVSEEEVPQFNESSEE